MIIVTASTGSAPLMTYLADVVEDTRSTEQQLTVGGKFNISVTIDVIAETTVDRDNIVDIITTNMLWLNKRIFEVDYNLYIQSLTYGPESQRDFGGRFFHIQSMTFDTYTEWYEEVDLSSYPNLTEINLTTELVELGE